jgi:hypothetical protein
MFNTPIPGQSLTTEPGNAPYERPPEMTDPEDALIYQIEQLTDERRMGSLLLLLENGSDIRTVTEGVLRIGVFKGIHSVDVSLIIAPAVHEYIRTTAEMVGIDYTEGFETDAQDEKLQYAINETKARKALSKIGAEPKTVPVAEVPDELVEDVAEDATEEVAMEASAMEAPAGLMARRV